MRDGLRNLYSVIKDADAHIRFAMLTGVSKFSKVSLFSGLNNLKDITIDARYSDLCGYTDEDVDTVFAPELPGLDRADIRRWYNGYNWDGTSVYNPFDVLLLLDRRQFRPYWFETGTPTFLIDVLTRHHTFTPELGQTVAMEDLLSTFDVDALAPEALLFHAFFASITHDWYRNSPIARYEGYWASVFYSHFAALGLDIRLEDVTHHGRIDMTVLFSGHVYLFELGSEVQWNGKPG